MVPRILQVGPLPDAFIGWCSVTVRIATSGNRSVYFKEEVEVQLSRATQADIERTENRGFLV